MGRRVVILAILAPLLSLIAVNLHPHLASADEGMFLPYQIPYAHINETYHADLTPEKVSTLTRAVVKVAIGAGGGSGFFVSPDGLVFTNRHVAADCIQDLREQNKLSSEPTPGFGSDFFFAKSYKDELRCQTYQLNITQEITDVTPQVMAGLKTAETPLPPPQRPAVGKPAVGKPAVGEPAALAKIAKGLIAQCEGLLEDISEDMSDEVFYRNQDALSTICVLNSLNAHAPEKYFLEKYIVIRDVRLVYAPSSDLANIGIHRTDYPLYRADFALLRAYGNQARILPFNTRTAHRRSGSEYGKYVWVTDFTHGMNFTKRFFANLTNRPLNTLARYLKPDTTHKIRDNDFIMTMGYPSGTSRVTDHFIIESQATLQYPLQIAYLQVLTGVLAQRLTQLASATEELLVQERERLTATQTTLRKTLEELRNNLAEWNNTDLVAKKKELDQQLESAIAANEKFKAAYGHIFPQLNSMYTLLNQVFPTAFWALNLSMNGIFTTPLSIINMVTRKTADASHNNDNVLSAMGELIQAMGIHAERDQIINQTQLNPMDKEVTIQLLSTALRMHKSEGYAAPFLDELAESINVEDHEETTPEELATRIVNTALQGSSLFSDPSYRQKLLDSSTEDLMASQDPLIILALKLQSTLQSVFTQLLERVSTIQVRSADYGEALYEVLGDKVINYYDANFSLRFTYGAVKGLDGFIAPLEEWSPPIQSLHFQAATVRFHPGFFNPFTSITRFPDVSTALQAGTLSGLGFYTPNEITYFKKAAAAFGDQAINFLTTEDVAPGNSGSPIINKDLKVTGMVYYMKGGYSHNLMFHSTDRTIGVSLPFAIQHMNMDVAGGIDVRDAVHTPNRISLELDGAQNGQSSYHPPLPTVSLPRARQNPK